MEKLPDVNKTIVVGTDSFNGEYIVMQLDVKDNTFELTANSVDVDKLFDDDDGEAKAKEYLDSDDYFWKSAVENDRTTLGLEEYNEEILNIDGWQLVLGEDNVKEFYDVYYMEDDEAVTELQEFNAFTNIIWDFNEEDAKDLFVAFNEIPLKNFNKDDKYLLNLAKRVIDIFDRSENFVASQYI